MAETERSPSAAPAMGRTSAGQQGASRQGAGELSPGQPSASRQGAPGALAPATLAVHAGRPTRSPGAPVNEPILLSSTFVAAPPDADGLAPRQPTSYARDGVGSWEALETAVGTLDGGEAVVLSSGMAAVTAALEVLLAERVGGRADGLAGERSGRRAPLVVAGRHGYSGTHALLDQLAATGRVRVERVAVEEPGALAEALAGGADVLWLESPVNPTMEVVDLALAARLGREARAVTVVDGTYATPLCQRPLEHGADVVVHSLTKAAAGHSDALLGAVVVPVGAARHASLRAHRARSGSVPGGLEVFLTLRGLRTLDVRLERAQASALVLAQRLAEHPAVRRVRYPGLPGDPGHVVARRQMSGFGSVLAVDVADAATAEAVAAGTNVWLHATSLGGVESLVERRRRHPAERASVPEGLLRLSVGIEHVDDLWADLDAALRAAAPPS